MALAERRTAASGGVQATVSNAAGVWTEITTAMLAAGWTLLTDLTSSAQWPNWVPTIVLPPVPSVYSFGNRVTNAGNRYVCLVGGTASSGAGPTSTTTQTEGTVTWEYVSASTANDAFYESTGESGVEKIIVRVQQYSTFVNIFFYQYESSGTGFNRINAARTASMAANQKTQQFNFTGATTINFAIIADKDSVCAVTVDQANVKKTIMFGNVVRHHDVSHISFVSNATVTAGLDKTFNFASGDPIAAGYKVGDPVMIVSQETSTASNFQIPLCSSKITALTTSSITVKEVKETVQAGALIGHDPMPFFCVNSGSAGGNPVSMGMHNLNDELATNIWLTVGEVGYSPAGVVPVRDTSVAEMDPNNRTGYQQLISQILVFGGGASQVSYRGRIPKFYHWNTQANNQWTRAVQVRTTAKDWIFVRDTPPSTGPAWVFGPFTATTATVSFQVFDFVTDWGYREVMPLESNNTSHRTTSIGQGTLDENRYHVVDPYGDNEEGIEWTTRTVGGESFADSNGNSRWFLGNLITVEPYPFDSSTATRGGTSNGFNSGFN